MKGTKYLLISILTLLAFLMNCSQQEGEGSQGNEQSCHTELKREMLWRHEQELLKWKDDEVTSAGWKQEHKRELENAEQFDDQKCYEELDREMQRMAGKRKKDRQKRVQECRKDLIENHEKMYTFLDKFMQERQDNERRQERLERLQKPEQDTDWWGTVQAFTGEHLQLEEREKQRKLLRDRLSKHGKQERKQLRALKLNEQECNNELAHVNKRRYRLYNQELQKREARQQEWLQRLKKPILSDAPSKCKSLYRIYGFDQEPYRIWPDVTRKNHAVTQDIQDIRDRWFIFDHRMRSVVTKLVEKHGIAEYLRSGSKDSRYGTEKLTNTVEGKEAILACTALVQYQKEIRGK